jgi:hypothetical protein
MESVYSVPPAQDLLYAARQTSRVALEDTNGCPSGLQLVADLVNPILAGVANYLVVIGIVSWLRRGPANTWMVLMLCLVGSCPICFLISGLLGWDESEMQKLRDAVDLVPSPFHGLAMLGYNLTRLGPVKPTARSLPRPTRRGNHRSRHSDQPESGPALVSRTLMSSEATVG